MGMRVFAIGDLHFDSKKEKPMDIFGENWIEHEEKIIRNWCLSVSDDDLVLIPGDISWAIRLNDALKDLEIIDNLPGKKVLIRGNHDYWWATKNKLKKLNFKSLEFLVNDVFINDKVIVCGVRAWDSIKGIENNTVGINNDTSNELLSQNTIYNNEASDSILDDIKIYKRELYRFKCHLN